MAHSGGIQASMHGASPLLDIYAGLLPSVCAGSGSLLRNVPGTVLASPLWETVGARGLRRGLVTGKNVICRSYVHAVF